MTDFIGYCRVSTDKQGKSGLGLEAQQKAIQDHLRPTDRLLEPLYVETESGKRNDRPKLAEALARCKETGATLLIAKLDRLARNVAFIANLMEEGVPFVACDMPTADKFMLHIFASVAQHEREIISKRTKDALAAAKRRGTKLGGYRGGPVPDIAKHQASGAGAARELSNVTAKRLEPIVSEIIAAGHTSLRQIASELNRRGVPTARGGVWAAPAVRNVLARLGRLNPETLDGRLA